MEKLLNVAIVNKGLRPTRLVSILLGIAVVVFAISPATAQDLEAFRKAAASDGVNVIPFPNLWSEARAIAGEVDRAKTEQTYEFSLQERQKDNLLRDVEAIQERIRTKEKEIEDFKKANPTASTSSFESELTTLRNALAEAERKVRDKNEELKKAVEAWKRLANARGGLREVFVDTLDELRNAKGSPSKYLGSSPKEEELNQFNRYIDIIEDEIEVGARTHRDQEAGAVGMIDKFEKLLEKTKP